jgi:indole-3-glycerol phosphate synthase
MEPHYENSFLLKIIGEKRSSAQIKERGDFRRIYEFGKSQLENNLFVQALKKDGILVIAEVKRSSPSSGLIKNSDCAFQVKIYEKSGADAISVLTEKRYFNGSLEDLVVAKRETSLPVLRKDFIIFEEEIFETARLSADSLLLISEALEEDVLEEFIKLSRGLGMEPLVECFSEEGMEKVVRVSPLLVGINSRNLHSLDVDIERAIRIFRKFRKYLEGKIVVAESGIKTKSDVMYIAKEGIRRFLIGETLMRSDSPEKLIRDFKSVFELIK